MIDAERKVDFSASDDLEMIRIEAVKPSKEKKEKVWDLYTGPTEKNYKQ